MRNLIRRTAHRLTLLLNPGTGKHRRAPHQPHPAAVRQTAPPPAHLPRHRSAYGLNTPLDGTANRLIRPYLLAHEQDVTFQRRRRLALGLDEHLIGAPATQGMAA